MAGGARSWTYPDGTGVEEHDHEEAAVSFAVPHYLWLLLIVPPLLILFFWWSERERRRLMTQFIQARLLPSLLAGVSDTRRKIRAMLVIAAVASLIFALARPQWGFDWQEVRQRGLDIIVAIDTSKSMLAEDIAPNRLARAKLAALDLMQQAKSDRLGLIAFAGEAFLQCPLTIDDNAFRQSVEALDVNIIPQGGTAIGEAVDTAAKAFKEGDNHKVLVLFTDGEDQDSDAVAAARRAKEVGVIIFTVGIGSAEGELLRIKTPDGQNDYVRDENGNVVKSHLNETLLKDIAKATPGGAYFRIGGARTIDTLYQQWLAPLPKSDAQEKLVRRAIERYHWPLGIAIVLLMIEMILPERKSSRRTEKASNIQNPTSNIQSAAVAALIAILFVPTFAKASPATAMRDYKAGKFKEAQAEFERLAAEDKKGDTRFIFNAGAAAYRGTNFDAAIKNFTAATTARDLKLQEAAYFNLGNTQFRLGQLAFGKEAGADLDEIQKHWEEAVKSYQSAVALDKTDADAAFNLEMARRGVEMIKQFRDAARQAKQAADEATRRRNYHRALEIMQQLLQGNPLGKQFEEFTKKLQSIDEIANPQQPKQQP
jgi:Ca-activated chloride channel family protein